MPVAGEIVWVDHQASVQFRVRPILFRLIRVLPLDTYVGWVWLDGYELDQHGDAVERRSIWVQPAGLRSAGRAPDPRIRNKPLNRAPVELPRQRATSAITTTGRTR